MRVSVYPDTPWRDAADLLAGAQQLWGANLLVDNALVDRLPALLAELAERGCHDVSLLSYVGPDDRRHLDRAGEQRLARIIDESPMPCRISVCFGARVPLPRLFAGIDNTGDCGAGYDFVSITPDQRVQSCSFQDHGMPAATAEDVLAAWRMQQVRLAQPSPRQGCARALPLSSFAAPLPPVAVWQAFSGNNSGECILVAKFETVDAAEKFLSELVPGWRSDAAYSPEWQSLFTEEGVTAKASSPSRVSPEELDRIGRSVIALAYDAGDAFPELRALAWKRGAFVTPGGVHVHEPTVLAAVRAHDRDDARELAATYLHEAARTYQHGDRVLVTMPFGTDGRSGSLTELKELLASYAGHRPVGVEFFGDEVSEADFLRVKQRLGDELAARPRLFAGFYSVGDVAETHAAAHRLAAALDEERARVVANGVLIDPIVRRKRAAVLAYRHDAYVQPLDGLVLKVSGSLWFTQERRSKASPRLVDRDALSVALASTVSPSQVTVSPQPDWMHALTVTIETDDPSHALAALGVEAERLGCNLRVWVDEVDPLAWAVRRLLA